MIFSESIAGLQSLLDQLTYYCSTWKLHINVDKSNIVVFRKGGRVKESEKWYIYGKPLEIVDQFAYLGIIFYYNNKFSKAEKQLPEQGRKALFVLKKNIRNMFLIIILCYHCLIALLAVSLTMPLRYGVHSKHLILRNFILIFLNISWELKGQLVM